MREVPKITIRSDSDLFKSLQQKFEQEAEKEAALAAEKIRKEILDKRAKEDAQRKAYLDSIKYYENEKIEFKNKNLRDNIIRIAQRRNKLYDKIKKLYEQEKDNIEELKNKCSHEMVLERRTSWKDEYDSWHDGCYERKCLECFLVEESNYKVDEYSYERSNKRYSKLEKSQVVILRSLIDGKEFQLEFEDLKF